MDCFQKRLLSRFTFDVVPKSVPLSNALSAVLTGSRSKPAAGAYGMEASAMALGLANKLSVGDSRQAPVIEANLKKLVNRLK